jgi:hypothetical protein
MSKYILQRYQPTSQSQPWSHLGAPHPEQENPGKSAPTDPATVTAREIRDDLDHLERTKYLASQEPDLEPESEEDLDEGEFDLESPVMGAQELLRFSCVRELLEA